MNLKWRPKKVHILIVVMTVGLAACGVGSTDTTISAPTTVDTTGVAPTSEAPTSSTTDAPPDTTATTEGDGGPNQIAVTVPAPNLLYWDIWVAEANGFFDAENVAVSFNIAAQAPMSVLESGGGDVVAAYPGYVFTAAAAGSDVVMIGTAADASVRLVGNESITDIEDLRGETLGVFNLLDFDNYLIDALLSDAGINRDEYDKIAVGATPEKLTALVNGAVAAAPLYQASDFQAEEQGMIFLGSALDLSPRIPLPYVMKREFGETNPDTVVGFLRGLLSAQEWLHDPANRESAIQIAATETGLDPELVGQTYTVFFEEGAYRQDMSIDLEAVEAVRDWMIETEAIDAELPTSAEILDTTYLTEAAGN